MQTTWRVEKVTETETGTVAELVQVEWFKKNPEYVKVAAEYDAVAQAEGYEVADERFADVDPPEFLDVEPGEDGAEHSKGEGRLTLVTTEGPELHAGDNVRLTVEVIPTT